ncbi:MAG: hypothetical protein ACK478_01805, partial [Flavobacteriales bacterium]
KDESKLIKNYLGFPAFVQIGLMRIKALLRKPMAALQVNTPFLIIEPNRIIADPNGHLHSVYFERIAETIGQERVTWITKKKDKRFPTAIALNQLPHDYPSPDKNEIRVLNVILKTLKKLLADDRFTAKEKAHIQSSLHIYFDDFRFYYRLFKDSKVKCVLFICHYQTEGLIAALNVLGIQAVEAQHGLIAQNDLYYAYKHHFAKGLNNADFPDHILVYGNYWKELLLRGSEFKPNQIHIAGDYFWRNTAAKSPTIKQNTVLICSQKTMHEEYVGYAEKLLPILRKYPDWRWIIKLHPLEANKNLYEPLKVLGFEIIDTERTLDDLLHESRIQISIYSTTFYDALGFDVVNFSLQNYGTHSDYAADMLTEKVALPLRVDEDPIARYYAEKADPSALLSRDEVYPPFDANAVKALLDSCINN